MPESAIISAPPVAPDEPALDLGYSVAVDAFSGPLDLLLFLVRKSELDIIDIPVATIADQFVALIREWQERGELDLEGAGDFILMAATLLEIKARTVAPPPLDEGESANEDEDDILDPRADLIGKLLAYRRFKEAVGLLNQLEAQRAQQVTRQLREDIPEDPDEATGIDLGELNVNQLSKLWYTLLSRLGGNGPRTVMKDDIPIEGSIRKLEASAIEQRELTLHGLFAAESTLQGRVTMLMATLECTRQRIVHATQHEQYGDVTLRFREEADRVITPVVFPPEEGGKKRRRRPPLVTFQAPVAPSADEAEDAPSEPEEKHETDEERFLRELNESCDLDGVLARVQDVEKGFQAYWDVLHPAPPPPVPQTIPLTAEEVPVAQAEALAVAPGAEPVTAAGEAAAISMADPAAVVASEAPVAVEPVAQAVADAQLTEQSQGVEARSPAAAEASAQPAAEVPPVRDVPAALVEAVREEAPVAQVEAVAEVAVAETAITDPVATESVVTEPAVAEALVSDSALTIAEVLPTPSTEAPVELAAAETEQSVVAATDSVTETMASNDAAAVTAADALPVEASAEAPAVGAAVTSDEQIDALADAAPLTADQAAVEQASGVAADAESGASGDAAVAAEDASAANAEASVIAPVDETVSAISVEHELAPEASPTNASEAVELEESTAPVDVAVEPEAVAEPIAESAVEPVVASDTPAAASEPEAEAIAATEPAAPAVEDSSVEAPASLARTLSDPVSVAVGDDAIEVDPSADQSLDEPEATSAEPKHTVGEATAIHQPSVVEQHDAVSAVPEPQPSAEAVQVEAEPVASIAPDSATQSEQSAAVDAAALAVEPLAAPVQVSEAAVVAVEVTTVAPAEVPPADAQSSTSAVADEPQAAATPSEPVSPVAEAPPAAEPPAAAETPPAAELPRAEEAAPVAELPSAQPASEPLPQTVVSDVQLPSIQHVAPVEPAHEELRPAARVDAPAPVRTARPAPAAPRLWSRTVILLASGLAGGSLAGWLMLMQQPEPLPLHGPVSTPPVPVVTTPVVTAPAVAEVPAVPAPTPAAVPVVVADPSQAALVPVSRPTLPEPGMTPSDRLLAAAEGPAAQWLEVATWPVAVPWYACLPRAPLPASLSAFAGDVRLADVPVAAWACDGAWAWCVAAPPVEPFALLPAEAFSVAPPVGGSGSTWVLDPDLRDLPVSAFADPEVWRLVIGDPTVLPAVTPPEATVTP